MPLSVSLLRQSFESACPTAQEKQRFAEQFYSTLFADFPQVQVLFAHTNMPEQTKKLMATLELILTMLTRPEVLPPLLQKLGQRHTQVGVKAEHYPMVAQALLATFAARLGSQWTAEHQTAWTEAYEAVATLLQEGEGGRS